MNQINISFIKETLKDRNIKFDLNKALTFNIDNYEPYLMYDSTNYKCCVTYGMCHPSQSSSSISKL